MSSGLSAITIIPQPGNLGSVSVGATVTGGKITYGGNVAVQTPGGSSRFAAITSTSNPGVLSVNTTNPWAGTGFGYILSTAEGDEIVVETDSNGNPTSYTNETTNEPAVPYLASYAAASLGTTNLTIGWENAAGAMQIATITLNVVPFVAVPVVVYTPEPTPVVAAPASGGLSLGAKLAIGASVLAVGGVGVAVAAQRGAFAGIAGEAGAAMESVRGRRRRGR
jgi:hypothetical protein